MPHSSGGGHSHHGSHRSSRSKSADIRYGTRYYRGSHRYAYYRNGVPQYYFSDRPYTLQTAKSEKIKTILINILTAIFGVFFAISGLFSIPHKVKLDYNTEIVISDSARQLTETEEGEMKDAFFAFQKKTGVTPAFFTISEKELERQGGDLQKFAYKLYVNTFDDEKHWLVVYCIDNVDKTWSWEGMIGDDCDSIITADLENEFTNLLQKNLQNNPKMISASVINAFETIGNKSGKIPFKKITALAFPFVLGGFCVFAAVKKFLKTVKKKAEDDPRINSIQCPTDETDPPTAKCQYCGGEYVMGLHTSCPHCGAPIETEQWD